MIITTSACNSTEEHYSSPLGIVVVVVFLCLCGLLGNGTIIWFLSFRIQKNPYSFYIFNLAISDSLFLIFMALSTILDRPEFDCMSKYSAEIFKRMTYLVYTLGLSLLAAISFQRCLSVLFPIWYRCHRPRHLSSVVCAGLWLLAILENLVAIYFCVVEKNQRDPCKKVDLFFVVLIFGIFTPVMCISGVTLFVKVQRVSQKRHPARIYVVILITILVFVICALPLAIHWFILFWIKMEERPKNIFHDVAKIFSCVNSLSNPIIYYFVGSQRKRKLHEPLRVVLERALWDEDAMTPIESVELGSESRGAQGGSEETVEELSRANAKHRDPQYI